MIIRDVTNYDCGHLLQIYAPYITDTAISFETTVPSLAEFSKRIEDTTKKFPWLIAEVDGQIAGFAYASSHRSRCAYDWAVEVSVYLSPEFHRQGVGRALYTELFKRLKKQGVIQLLAGIAIPNEKSVGFHEFFGFKQVALYPNIGYKLGRWWDVGWWQLQLDLPVEPKAVVLQKNII